MKVANDEGKSLKQIHFKVPSSLRSLEFVLAQLEHCYDPRIGVRDWSQCRLLLAEGFTNTVRHAHRQLPEATEIELEMTLFPQSLRLRIWDQGPGFDLLGYCQQKPGATSELPEGGWGLNILVTLADSLSYDRPEPERNCLVITKTFAIPLLDFPEDDLKMG